MPSVTKNIGNTKRLRSDEDGIGEASSFTLDSAVQLLLAQFSETKEKIEELQTNINTKIDAVKTELEEKLSVVSLDIQSLRADCAEKFRRGDAVINTICSRLDRISDTVGNLENRNELVVSGVPFLTGESLEAIFASICKQLDLKAAAVPLADLRRMATGKLSDGDESLIVEQFALRNVRDDFYGAYLRASKPRNLKLRHFGFNADQRVNINENLTVTERRIKQSAVRLKKNGGIVSVFTKLRIVYVKKDSDSPPIAIHSIDQLEQFTRK